MPRVSVVLPVYNCVRYIKDAVKSILDQSFNDFEIVIVDDGSNDGSQDILKEYSTLPYSKVITHPTNMGICRSLNDGMLESNADLIAIQHADDMSTPSRLERQVQYLDTHPDVDLVAGWIQYINKKGKKKKDDWWLREIKHIPDDPELIRNRLLEMNIIPHPTVMFRRKIIDTVGLYDPEAFPTEDYDYWLRISEKHNIGVLHEVLCLYRHHSRQLTRTEKMQRIREKTVEAVQRAKKRRGIE
jgi:glycosyltransferase involved in cell wall biosynthesis